MARREIVEVIGILALVLPNASVPNVATQQKPPVVREEAKREELSSAVTLAQEQGRKGPKQILIAGLMAVGKDIT